jgi:hypothetical protein
LWLPFGGVNPRSRCGHHWKTTRKFATRPGAIDIEPLGSLLLPLLLDRIHAITFALLFSHKLNPNLSKLVTSDAPDHFGVDRGCQSSWRLIIGSKYRDDLLNVLGSQTVSAARADAWHVGSEVALRIAANSDNPDELPSKAIVGVHSVQKLVCSNHFGGPFQRGGTHAPTMHASQIKNLQNQCSWDTFGLMPEGTCSIGFMGSS